MARVKRAVNAHKKRRVVMDEAKGYRGQRSRLYRKAKEQILHSRVYAFNDRREKKGEFRRLWITRINAAVRDNGLTYTLNGAFSILSSGLSDLVGLVYTGGEGSCDSDGVGDDW